MTSESIKDELQALVEGEWGLHPMTCDEPAALKRKMRCFWATIDASRFGALVEGTPSLQPVSGWRDDYGVPSGTFRYQDQPLKVALMYTRPTSFWNLPPFDELVRRGALGAVSISVEDVPEP